MANAYKCNWCKRFFDGRNTKEITLRDREDMLYPSPVKIFDFCDNCLKVFLAVVKIEKEKTKK